MRLGVLLPHRGVVMRSARRPDIDEVWSIARAADQADLDLWVGDSVVAKPRMDPLTTLAYAAAITTRSRLGTAVLLPALRQPTVLANELANLDQISQGRLVLGLGVGWPLPAIEAEWQACGRDYNRRTADLEEHVRVWRMLWSGGSTTYSGSGFDLVDHTIAPLPWNSEGPPILMPAGKGGRFRKVQLDRFARLGDGIITTYLTDEQCCSLRILADEALEREGRQLPNFPMCVYTTIRLDADPQAALATTNEFLAKYYGTPAQDHGGLMALGPPEHAVDLLRRYAAAGVTDLCIRFAGDDQRDQVEKFITDVVPAVH